MGNGDSLVSGATFGHNSYHFCSDCSFTGMFTFDQHLRKRVAIRHRGGVRIERQNSRSLYFWVLCVLTVGFALFCNIIFDTIRRHSEALGYLLAMLALSLIGYLIGVAIVVWGAFGVEEIVVEAGALRWKRTALKWSRTQDIPLERIVEIRAITPWHRLDNTVELTADGRHYQIGDKLLRNEAIELAQHLRRAVGLHNHPARA
jgi:hypothetical protein